MAARVVELAEAIRVDPRLNSLVNFSLGFAARRRASGEDHVTITKRIIQTVASWRGDRTGPGEPAPDRPGRPHRVGVLAAHSSRVHRTRASSAAAAAKAIEDHGMADVTPELASAFTRSRGEARSGMPRPDRDRPALHSARPLGARGVRGRPHDRPARRSARCPATTRPQPLRGICAMAHAHFVRPDALDVCADLLADEWRATRIGAARGLGDSGRIDATAVLRYKLLRASDDGEVLAACFDALFALRRESATVFAREMLALPTSEADAAALALGSNRATEARRRSDRVGRARCAAPSRGRLPRARAAPQRREQQLPREGHRDGPTARRQGRGRRAPHVPPRARDRGAPAVRSRRSKTRRCAPSSRTSVQNTIVARVAKISRCGCARGGPGRRAGPSASRTAPGTSPRRRSARRAPGRRSSRTRCPGR